MSDSHQHNRNNTTFRQFVRCLIEKTTKIVKDIDYYLFLEGCISGMFGVVISHPFDTIKSNLQTKKKVQYNFKFLYKGIGSPFFGTGFEKALVFGTFNNVHGFLKREYDFSSVTNTVISGGIAGFCASFIVTPIDKIKLMHQTTIGARVKPCDLFSCKSLLATFTREVPGFAIYFTTYTQIEKRIYNIK